MPASAPDTLDRPGHVLAFQDEFDRPFLDEARWLPAHLPQWSSRERARARLDFDEGHLALRIDADQPPWCPEFDGGVRVSSLQTGVSSGPLGSTRGQHRFNRAAVVREAQPRRVLYAPERGLVEMRARACPVPGCHSALWMIGLEDRPEDSTEICVSELFGHDRGTDESVVRFGVHPFGDPRIADDFRHARLPIDTADFHVYALEWTAAGLRFLVDGAEIGSISQSPAYPMQLMLGLYDRTPPGDDAHERLERRFVVDYVRGWRAAG
ncbi:MAG TPA: glycoside hydrolase family 16 protein [Burkholderiaceae bacterium]